jgi:SAM-dependent methyltransferase
MDNNVPFVFGSDFSKEMISEAMKKKFAETGNLFVNDIQNIALKDCRFDCALLLYDSLNYLLDESALNNALHEIQRILKNNGLFIFDVVSEEHCIEHYGDFHESEYWENDGYSRHSFYDSRNGYQFNEFRIVIRGETYIEKHKQKIYTIEHLKSVLFKNSFDIIGIYDDFSNEYHNNDSGRLHFLCSNIKNC